MTQPTAQARERAWFALADARRCRLLCCCLTTQGAHHVNEVATLQNSSLQHEWGRPLALGEVAVHGEASWPDVASENLLDFARAVSNWLHDKLTEFEIDQLAVFSPAGFMGVLRGFPIEKPAAQIRHCEGNLMHLGVGTLAQHPMVRALLPAPPKH
jgi:hypothetical protein